MIGYETEDKAYCFEVTYNYGIESYPMGSGLASFTLAVDDVQVKSVFVSPLAIVVDIAAHEPNFFVASRLQRLLLQS
jgi:hypothetical protein